MKTNKGPQAWLSRDECAALRGLAIMAIVLHNYCHWLGFAVKENEFTFNAANTERVWGALASPDAMLPVHLLSHFGHYGVPVFLFLSGFGLVMKYERGAAVPPAGRFVRYHYMKLLRMMVPGFVAFTIVDAITPGPFHFKAGDVVAQLLMVINLLPHPDGEGAAVPIRPLPKVLVRRKEKGGVPHHSSGKGGASSSHQSS